jgi:uncharacterized protein (TIGR02301 family)
MIPAPGGQNRRLDLASPQGHIEAAMHKCALLVSVLLLGLPAGAARAAEAAAPAGPVAPFEAGLERLAEILGSLHYLRGICGANEGNKWRNEMQALMDAEAPSGQRRSQFIAHFNRGYRSYQQTYHSCTAAADLAVRRYLEEGSKIAREVTARYSN